MSLIQLVYEPETCLSLVLDSCSGFSRVCLSTVCMVELHVHLIGRVLNRGISRLVERWVLKDSIRGCLANLSLTSETM